ncbi:NAC domain-containing protein 83-like [Coffea arabica]
MTFNLSSTASSSSTSSPSSLPFCLCLCLSSLGLIEDMGCLKFVKDGVIRLPPGFRFQPTDEEIVFQYLLRKTFSCPLPASIIPEINVCKHDPWDLPGDLEQDRYFFSNKEAKYPNGNRTNRATDTGYWKATGVDKQIVSSRRKPLLGLRKTLVFHKGKSPHGSRTDWIMHEYRLILTGKTACCSQQTAKSSQSSSVQLGNWVLCHIFLKKGSTKAVDETVQVCKNYKNIAEQNVRMDQHRFENFTIGNLSEVASTSSSSSFFSDPSVLTEVSSSQCDYEETSSPIV